MSVKKEASGRRSVQVQVEVPGTPEEVWQAIATGPGVSAWFVPTEIVEQDGKPVAVKSNFGPGMESTATVTSWDPPRKFAAESPGWTPDMPTMATEWSVEARAGGVCVVRVVHSLFASTDDWDNQLEGTEFGWPGFFRILRLYLAHFRGQRSAIMQWNAMPAGTAEDAWATLTAALGLKGVVAAHRWTASPGNPSLQRRRGACRPISAPSHDPPRQAVPGHRRPWRRQLQRHGHGDDQFLSLWRSGCRSRRPRETALAGVGR